MSYYKLDFITVVLIIIYSGQAQAQSYSSLEVEGDSKQSGTMYISPIGDCSSINIQHLPFAQSLSLDSSLRSNLIIGGQYDDEKWGNTFIGIGTGSAHNLETSTLVGASAGVFQSGSESISIGAGAGLQSNGSKNILIGTKAGELVDGDENIIIGSNNLIFQGMSSSIPLERHENILIGNNAGEDMDVGRRNIVIGHNAGPEGDAFGKLYIGRTNDNKPLIGGTFDGEEVDINGYLFVDKDISVNERVNVIGSIQNTSGDIRMIDDLRLTTTDGTSRGLRLVEITNGNEFGFKLNYNGNSDLLELSSLGFNNNQGIRALWTKQGYFGIGNQTPITPLHINSGTDAENGSGGYLTIGSSIHNLVFDRNEIMARTDTDQPNGLYLNNNGGEVIVGSRLRLAFSDTDASSDTKGQIRYNRINDDFEGFDGITWYSLTSNKSSTASVASHTNSTNKAQLSGEHGTSRIDYEELELRIAKLERTIEVLLKRINE